MIYASESAPGLSCVELLCKLGSELCRYACNSTVVTFCFLLRSLSVTLSGCFLRYSGLDLIDVGQFFSALQNHPS